jgi:hypothetical protein
VPGWLKVLLIVAIIIIVLIVAVVGAGVYWWMRNKDALIARAQEVATEAKDFGSHSDNQGCVDESIARYKREPGLKNRISTGVFMRMCLDESRPTPGFCDEVPRVTEFIKSARWRIEQCERIGLARDSYCQQLFQQVQSFCEERAER